MYLKKRLKNRRKKKKHLYLKQHQKNQNPEINLPKTVYYFFIEKR